MRRGWLRTLAIPLLLMLVACPPARAETKTIARCGRGFLEEVDGYKVLHVRGTPYEMGYQQGALLKDDIRELVRFLFEVKAKELKVPVGGINLLNPRRALGGIAATQRKYVPERFFEELRGVADGAGMDMQDIIAANFIPELFHCSGFALSGSATKDGTLYHGRVLDYGCDWRLQEHAVLTVAEPEGKIPFLNVTYAGFIGSVTGMNARHVSIGEMGGRGLGHWEGVPMALLIRMALEEADTLDEAVAIFRDHPRTCEYYYVIADGKSDQGVGMEASWDTFGVIKMGESHPRLPHAVKDAVVLSVGNRYQELVRRVRAGHGTFDAESARMLMSLPVAMKSNLHSVLFETKTTRLWVANASRDGAPAATQPYHAFTFLELLTHRPDTTAPALTAPPAKPSAPARSTPAAEASR
jgi:isopenicillin-N N-acyltransferase like protein